MISSAKINKYLNLMKSFKVKENKKKINVYIKKKKQKSLLLISVVKLSYVMIVE